MVSCERFCLELDNLQISRASVQGYTQVLRRSAYTNGSDVDIIAAEGRNIHFSVYMVLVCGGPWES